MATITVNPGVSYQTMKGWEATAQAGQEYNMPSETPEYPSATYAFYKDALLDGLIDFGSDRLRVEVAYNDVNPVGYSPGLSNPGTRPTTAAPGDFRYERMDRAMDTIGIPLKNRLIAQGEDLWINLNIVDFRTDNYAIEDEPAEYAFFIFKFVEHFRTTYGFLPDSIEAMLEPDNPSTNSNWTAAKLADAIVAADAYLVANLSGYTAGEIRWIAPSNVDGTATPTWYAAMKSANAAVTALIDEVSYHRYVSLNGTHLAAIESAAAADGKSTAMLEYGGATFEMLYDDLITAKVSSWQQYTIAFPYTGWADSGFEYFQVNTSTWAVSLCNRSKYLRHFFKYVRRGAVRKGVTNADAGYYGIPFINPNGSYVVPIMTTLGGTINVAGLPAGTYGIRYTTGSANSAPSAFDQSYPDQTITGGQNVSFNMPSAGMATVYDVNYLPESIPQPAMAGGFFAV